MANFYKQNGSYYMEDTGQKILNPTELAEKSKYGVEVKAPTANIPSGFEKISGAEFGTKEAQQKAFQNIKPVGNIGQAGSFLIGQRKTPSTSDMISVKPQTPDTSEMLSSAFQEAAAGNIQKTNEALFRQEQETQRFAEQALQDKQKRINEINELSKKQLETTDPTKNQFYEQRIRTLQNLSDSAEYASSVQQEDFKRKRGLVDEMEQLFTDYSANLNQAKSTTSLASFASGSVNKLQEDFVAKQGMLQTTYNMLAGNISQGQEIINGAFNQIDNLRNQQINYANSVLSFNEMLKSETRGDMELLRADQKEAIQNQIDMIETKRLEAEEVKNTISNLMSSPETAQISKDAGIDFNDTRETMATKLRDYFVKNPQLDIQLIGDINNLPAGIYNKVNNTYTQLNTGMRTDRHNNPIAVAVGAGKTNEFTDALDRNGIDWAYGDPFPNNEGMVTISIEGDPVEASRVILEETGAIQNWYINHTGKDVLPQYGVRSNKDFKKLDKDSQDKIIKGIYKSEGGSGELVDGNVEEYEGLSDYAKEYYDNPALLDTVTPTKRGQIMEEISGAGLSLKRFTIEKLNAGQRENISDYETLINEAKASRMLLEEGLNVGPIASKAQSVKALIGKARPEFVNYRSFVSKVSSKLLNILSGAAVSPSEYKRISGFIPVMDEDEKTAKVKIDNFISEMEKSKNNYIKRATDTSFDIQQSALEKIDDPLDISGKEKTNDPLNLF